MTNHLNPMFFQVPHTKNLQFGKHIQEVSCLGFGAMGMTHHRGIPKDRNEMIQLLRKAADLGINLFDTAEIYGPFNNEILVGDAFGKREDILICTKFGHKIVDGKWVPGGLDSSSQHIRKVCEESLKRLRRERIDIFYQHRLDPEVPIEEVARTCSELIKEGKIRGWGLCEVSPKIIRRAHEICPLTAVQSEYHLMWRRPETAVLALLRNLGVAFVPYSPLNRGFLSGAITPNTKFFAANDNRASLPRFTPEAIQQNLAIVRCIERFGAEHGMSPVQVTLSWLLRKANVIPIPGTTQYDHLLENIQSIRFEVPEEEWRELEDKIFQIPIQGDRYAGIEKTQTA
ncbi:aldo/keto reductase [uncultured Parasutterella sp.]|jgi:aryl-alcohol dehydrogenase-like predicted oxidoreductase|uniref:aldo/keto reductase n=1 Tax=uncultured Parasutterella sp. TaxID=1263098 RepID=UPI0025DCC69A|nr:aldo/keto reductase [uncultured Parasutterella sp.]